MVLGKLSPCMLESKFKMVPALPQPGPFAGCAPHPSTMEPNIHPGINIAMFMHLVQMQANAVKFAHQSLCNPKTSTLLKVTQKGFLKGCPNIMKILILKYLNPSPNTAKGDMKHPQYGIKSTSPKPPRSHPCMSQSYLPHHRSQRLK
jgi:hypothetical protein